jgi:hypothetical protein
MRDNKKIRARRFPPCSLHEQGTSPWKFFKHPGTGAGDVASRCTTRCSPEGERYSREEKRWSFETGGCPVAVSEMPFWSQSGITALLAAGFGAAFATAFAGVGELGSAINPRFLASSMIARASLMSNAMWCYLKPSRCFIQDLEPKPRWSGSRGASGSALKISVAS